MNTGSQRSDRKSVALAAACVVLAVANLFGVFMIVNSLVDLVKSQGEVLRAVLDRLQAPSRPPDKEETLIE